MESRFSLQRLLWAIAGAEIPILEKCRTDHKKFGAIGATIAMTSFIAFLSGTSAAWFFTQSGDDKVGNIGWAMAFGVVWATLIFCIDRSLVITMKKDPENKSATWWLVPLLSRASLALIIAFMVSIPLELVVFKDFIAEQSYMWNENKSNTLAKNSRANRGSLEAQKNIDEGQNNLKRLDDQKATLEGERADLQTEIARQQSMLNNPNTQAFRNAKAGYNNATSKIANLRTRIANADQWSRQSLQAQKRTWEAKRSSCLSTMNVEKAEWNKPINERISELKEEIQAKEGEISDKKDALNKTQNQILQEQQKRSALIEQRDSLVEEHDKVMAKGNHFIQNFEILEYAVSRQTVDCTNCLGKGKIKDKLCNACHGTGKITSELPTECYFLWLIRLLFFIIELLPTVVKIVMPIGAYDRMLHSEEHDMEVYLNSENYLSRIRKMHDLEIQAHEEQLITQKNAEKEMRETLIKKLQAAQMEVAELAVENWRKNELKKIDPSSDGSKSDILS